MQIQLDKNKEPSRILEVLVFVIARLSLGAGSIIIFNSTETKTTLIGILLLIFGALGVFLE